MYDELGVKVVSENVMPAMSFYSPSTHNAYHLTFEL